MVSSLSYHPCVFSASLHLSVLLNRLSIYHAWMLRSQCQPFLRHQLAPRREQSPVSIVRAPTKNRTRYGRMQLLSITAWHHAFGIPIQVAIKYAISILGISLEMVNLSRSQWPRGLRIRSAAACLLGLWVRIPLPLGVWMSVSCELCHQAQVYATGRLTSKRGVVLPETDRVASIMRRLWPTRGCTATEKRER